MFEDRGARMIAAQFDQVRSAIDIFVKDIGLVSEAAAQSGASIPLTTTARQLYQLGHELGMGHLDDSALIEVVRRNR
jgi:3-hydroxyisobutyrate dehydrogenase